MKKITSVTPSLGLISTTSVVIGAIVGVGIFFTPSRVAELTGSGRIAMYAWLVGGIIAMLGALSFAELGGMYPKSGGQYAILRDAYNPLVGFLYVFCNATAIQCGAIAIIAIVCAQNLGLAISGQSPSTTSITVSATALILGLTVINIIGVRFGAAIQNITVFAKLLTLLAVAGLAAIHTPAIVEAKPAATTSAGDNFFSLLFAGLVPVLFSYGGWQHALWIGGEVKNPRRTVPRALVVGVAIVIVIYLLANWAYLRLLGETGVATSTALAAEAVSQVLPAHGARVVAFAVALSAFGVLNAQLLSGPRLISGMARDGRFFAPFAASHSRFATPHYAISLLGGLGLLLLWAAGQDGVDKLLTGVVLIDALFTALTGLAVILLRQRQPMRKRSVRVPLYPIVPLAFVLGEAAAMYGVFQDPAVRSAAYIGIAWVLCAVLVFLIFFRHRSPDAPPSSGISLSE